MVDIDNHVGDILKVEESAFTDEKLISKSLYIYTLARNISLYAIFFTWSLWFISGVTRSISELALQSQPIDKLGWLPFVFLLPVIGIVGGMYFIGLFGTKEIKWGIMNGLTSSIFIGWDIHSLLQETATREHPYTNPFMLCLSSQPSNCTALIPTTISMCGIMFLSFLLHQFFLDVFMGRKDGSKRKNATIVSSILTPVIVWYAMHFSITHKEIYGLIPTSLVILVYAVIIFMLIKGEKYLNQIEADQKKIKDRFEDRKNNLFLLAFIGGWFLLMASIIYVPTHLSK